MSKRRKSKEEGLLPWPEPPSREKTAVGIERRLLILDDDERYRRALAKSFKGYGYSLHEASSVHEARGILTHEGGSWVIILDLDMPRTFGDDTRISSESGLDLLNFLSKRREKYRVIVLTGYPDLLSASEARDYGIFSYQAKSSMPIIESLRFDIERAFEDLEKASETKKRVFIAYDRKDTDISRKLYTILKNEGFEPWMDVYDILPGQRWQNVIEKALREADFVVILLSPNSTRAGYLQKEIRIALEAVKERREDSLYMIPVRVKPCVIPDTLSKYQVVDLFEEGGFPKLISSLERTI